MAENSTLNTKEKTYVNWERIFVYTCIIMSFFIMLTCLSIMTFAYRKNIPYVQNYFPAPTATPPHILVLQPADNVKVTNDNFSNNLGEWSIYYRFSKAEVKDGKLFLESFEDNQSAIGYCYSCSFVVRTNNYLRSPYYLQADFNTDREINAYYGLVFNIIIEKNNYYQFMVNPTLKTYNLNKFQNYEWVTLTMGESSVIRPYPETNTLSVDFDKGIIKIYINGQAITSVTDKNPTDFGKIGAIVGDAGFKLIVDNLFAYHK